MTIGNKIYYSVLAITQKLYFTLTPQLPLVFAFYSIILLLNYFWTTQINFFNSTFEPKIPHYSLLKKEKSQEFNPRVSIQINNNIPFRQILTNPSFSFDANKNSVIVVLHIQKTAGTLFENFIATNLSISSSCNCKITYKTNQYGNQIPSINNCNCNRTTRPLERWIFFRYNVGWPCGVHADFTELFVSGCVDRKMNKFEKKQQKRKYYYTTILRDPIERFFSEFRHIRRGATWTSSRNTCNETVQKQSCFDLKLDWKNIGLSEFLNCSNNMAFNRQTQMLADMSLVNCKNISTTMEKESKERIILESAKHNLKNFAFFGIKERWEETQFIFEKTFHLKTNGKLGGKLKKKEPIKLTDNQWKLVFEKNHLDIQLYEYANQLFDKRLKNFLNS